jgi:hypothetical protein
MVLYNKMNIFLHRFEHKSEQNGIENWKIALKNRKFCICFIVLLSAFALQMLYISGFQSAMELRNGFSYEDPVMRHFPIVSLDWLTFIAIYSAHLLAIVLAIRKPQKFFQLALGYFFVYFFRIFSMYMLPLDPPIGLIPLEDPFLIWFGNGVIINKDLFYSGHTATTFMIFLVTENRKAKAYILVALAIVVVGVLLQHVHYSIDVYSAFFFSYTAYRVGKWVMRKLGIADNAIKEVD